MDEFNQTLDSGLPGQNTGDSPRFTPQLNLTLLGMSKWINFVSIFMIVMVCLLALAMLFAGSMMATMLGSMPGSSGAGMGAAGIIFMLIYLGLIGYITYLLYISGRDIKRGIQTGDQATLENGFTCMRRYWKFIGILLAIVLAIYVLMFLFMGVFAASMSGR